MAGIRKFASSAVRWGWFGLLVLLAFGYLVAGLSRPPRQRTEIPPGTPVSGENQAAAGESPAAIQTANQASDWAALQPAISAVDRCRQQRLEEAGLVSAEMADWLTVCRRLSLALVGNGLSLEEIRQLDQSIELFSNRNSGPHHDQRATNAVLVLILFAK